MTQTITRLYATEDQASKAVAELQRRHYRDVFKFSAPAEGGSSVDDLVEQMAKAHILKSQAKIYAAKVTEGGHLVTVHAPFSGGHRATWVLESYDPIPSGVTEPSDTDRVWDSATPVSSALGWPVLSKTQLPFETVMGVSSLMRSCTFSGCLGFSLLSKSATPVSDALGLPTLSANPTPLSSALGLSTLSASPTPLSSSLGLPLLK